MSMMSERLVWTIVLCATAASALCDEPKDSKELYRRLAEGGDPAAAVALARLKAAKELNDGLSKGGRTASLCAWAIYQSPAEECTTRLKELVNSNDQVLAYWATRALGRIGDRGVVPILVSLIPEKSSDLWELARHVKGQGLVGWVGTNRKDRKNTPIVAEPGMRNIRVAYAATRALGDVGGDEAGAALVKALSSEQYIIRYGAAHALGRMTYQPALETLQRMAKSDPVLIVRKSANRAAAAMIGCEQKGEPTPPKLPGAIAFLKVKDRTHANFGFRDSYPYPTLPWYGWGENLYVLSPPRPDGKLTNLTRLANGGVQGPEVSYDGKKILFAMRTDLEKDGFHIYEINVDGTGLKQLTSGNCNDVDPQYLPDGRIVFCSDRAGYREYYHQERSRVLYVMEADGSDIHQITFNPNQDYEPIVLRDGRVLYGSYRFYGQDGSPPAVPGESHLQRIETVLRTVRPDGSEDQLYYGSMRGAFYCTLRPMPDSLQYSGWSRFGNHIGVSVSFPRQLDDGRLICMTPAGLTVVYGGCAPLDCEEPLFPEILNIVGGERVYIHPHDRFNPIGRFTTPYPVGGDWILVSHAPWHDTRGNAYGIYLFNLSTCEMTPVYDDPEFSEVDIIPLWPRSQEVVIPSPATPGKSKTGFIYCVSVFNADLPFDRERVKYVRVLEALYCGLSINANAAFRSRVLGTVPIAPDGSFYVEVPADTPLHFQLLDERENILVHETAFNYVRGGEVRGCMGCHEPKGLGLANADPVALRRSPYVIGPKRGGLIYMGRLQRGYNLITKW